MNLVANPFLKLFRLFGTFNYQISSHVCKFKRIEMETRKNKRMKKVNCNIAQLVHQVLRFSQSSPLNFILCNASHWIESIKCLGTCRTMPHLPRRGSQNAMSLTWSISTWFLRFNSWCRSRKEYFTWRIYISNYIGRIPNLFNFELWSLRD